jgi:hypothetical protein
VSTTQPGAEPAPSEVTDLIPKPLRTVLYAVGTFDSLGVVPALLAADLTVAAGVASALAGGCLAVAFGYRPTR